MILYVKLSGTNQGGLGQPVILLRKKQQPKVPNLGKKRD